MRFDSLHSISSKRRSEKHQPSRQPKELAPSQPETPVIQQLTPSAAQQRQPAAGAKQQPAAAEPGLPEGSWSRSCRVRSPVIHMVQAGLLNIQYERRSLPDWMQKLSEVEMTHRPNKINVESVTLQLNLQI